MDKIVLFTLLLTHLIKYFKLIMEVHIFYQFMLKHKNPQFLGPLKKNSGTDISNEIKYPE